MATALAEVLGHAGRASPRIASACRPSRRSRRCSDGDVVVLENTRFHAGEEKNDPAFAAAARGSSATSIVNDAFSAAHRAHASTEGVAHLLPSYAGRLMQAELEALEAALGHAGAPGDGDRRRLEGLHQARPARQSGRQGGCAGHRRRDGQHVPGGRGQVASASRCRKPRCTPRRATSWPRRAGSRLRDRTAGRRRDRRPSSSRARPTRTVPVDAVPADQMVLDVGPATVADLVAPAARP